MLTDLSPSFLSSHGIKAVLFDKDGTLLDSLGSWARVLKGLCVELVGVHELPPETADELAAMVGIDTEGRVSPSGPLASGTTASLLEALRDGLDELTQRSYTPALSPAAQAPSGIAKSEDPDAFASLCARLMARRFPKGVPDSPPMTGAERMLWALASSGVPLGLVTNDDEDRTLADLARLKWRDLFSFIACGDSALEAKPSPWAVYEFARMTGVNTREIAVVGDSEVDRLMAVASGAGLFVLVTGGFA